MKILINFCVNLFSITLISTTVSQATDDMTFKDDCSYTIHYFKISRLSENINTVGIKFPGCQDAGDVIWTTLEDIDTPLPLPYKYCVNTTNAYIRDLTSEQGWRALNSENQSLSLCVCIKGMKDTTLLAKDNIFDRLQKSKVPFGKYQMRIVVDLNPETPFSISFESLLSSDVD